jgi:uncharacterized protein (DUF58 family)
LTSKRPADLALGPEELARLRTTALRAERVMHGRLQGIHRSVHHGASIEFADHKEYTPGDDLRHVDWRAVARFDHYFVKRFDHETNARVCLALDGSGSMAYGAAGRLSKYAYGSVLAACLSLLLLRQQDAVGTLIFDEEIRVSVPPRSGLDHYQHLTAAMDGHAPAGQTRYEPVLERAHAVAGQRGMVFLISDCFHDPEALTAPLRRLTEAGHQVTLLQLLDGDELDLPFQETLVFEGLETGQRLLAEPHGIRSRYQELLSEHLSAVREACDRARVDRRLIDTRQPPIEEILRLTVQAPRRRRGTG